MLKTWRLTLFAELKAIMQGNSNSEGLCFFLGAGADIASGGVQFSELKKRCLQMQGIKLPRDPSLLSIDDAFDAYFSRLSETDRSAVLDWLLRETRALLPSDGYKLLVLLAREKCVSAVVTTNFDNLLESTTSEMGIDAFQIFAPGISIPPTFLLNRRAQKAIYLKMHGDVDGQYVTHITGNEIQNRVYAQEYSQLLQHLLTRNTVVVAGYSGHDEQIAGIFASCLDHIQTVYWCNPTVPDPTAPLVKLLCGRGKLQYIPSNFDNFTEEIASEVFNDRMIFHADSIFIWSLIKTKITKLQTVYLDRLAPFSVDDLTDRKLVLEQYDQFLAQSCHNMFVLSGKQGVGKSSFIAKTLYRNESDNIHLIPITAPGSLSPDACAYLVENLGYITANPVAVLYQMAEWLRESRKCLVFIFDAIGNSYSGKEQTAQYLSGIIELAYILRHVANVKFMLSVREEVWENELPLLDQNYLHSILWRSPDTYKTSSFCLDIFTDTELMDVIRRKQQNFDEEQLLALPEEIRNILREPFFCGLSLQTNSLGLIISTGPIGLIPMIKSFLDVQNLTFKDKQSLQKIAEEMLLRNSAYISSVRQEELGTVISSQFLDLADEQISFRHPLFGEYFLIRRYQLQHLNTCLIQSELDRIVDLFLKKETKSFIYESLMLYLSSPEESIDVVCEFLMTLLNHVKADRETMLRVNQLTAQVAENWVINRTSELLEWIDYVNPQSDVFVFLSKRLIYASAYLREEEAYQLLYRLRRKCPNSIALECYVIINERFSNGLKQTGGGHEKDYFQKFGGYIKTGNPMNDLVQLVWIMGKVGPDNINPAKYDRIAKCIKEQMTANAGALSKECRIELKDSFLRNAYMIFFNANNNLEEKYYCFSQKSKTAPIIKTILYTNDGISADQLGDIRTCVDHFDETIEFFVCNLLFIVSMLQDPQRAQSELDALYASFREDVNVLELDFFLSALFMSCYVLNPRDRTPYLMRFERTVTDYETLLFLSAADGRASSCRRFSNRFDLEFEDGFNALTNYTYTAPIANYIGGQKQSVDIYLQKYWELLCTLQETGNYETILRLLHAISQMIANWPKEGFEALGKFVAIQHPIVRRGLIRVLSQNYLRHPHITKHFLKEQNGYFTSQELLEIYGNTNINIEYHTLEQLQWARIFYFVRVWLNPHGLEKLLSVFLYTDTLETAIAEIISLLSCPDNGESRHQTDPTPAPS